jgi:hypothetical protein
MVEGGGGIGERMRRRMRGVEDMTRGRRNEGGRDEVGGMTGRLTGMDLGRNKERSVEWGLTKIFD